MIPLYVINTFPTYEKLSNLIKNTHCWLKFFNLFIGLKGLWLSYFEGIYSLKKCLLSQFQKTSFLVKKKYAYPPLLLKCPSKIS